MKWLALFALATIAGAGFTLARVVRARRDAAIKKDWEGVARFDASKMGFQPKYIFKIDPGVSTSGVPSDLQFHPDSIEKGLRTAIGKPVTMGFDGPIVGTVVDVTHDGKLIAREDRNTRLERFRETHRKQNVQLLRLYGRDIPDDYQPTHDDNKFIRRRIADEIDPDMVSRIHAITGMGY